jgi:hypothetical protein
MTSRNSAPLSKAQGALLGSTNSDFSRIPIHELGRGTIIDRIPVEVSDFYTQKDVGVLVQMLADSAHELNARTIATLIALIGDGRDEHVVAVAAYGEKPKSDFSATMMALGMIANRTGSELALVVLADQFFSGEPDRERAAALGLSLSGDARALEMLDDRAAFEQDATRKELLRQAIRENSRVAQYGLKQYYLQPAAPLVREPLAEAGIGGKEWLP